MSLTSRLRSASRLVAGSPSYSLLRRQDRHLDARAVQLAGDDEAVAAVVAPARDDHGAARGETFEGKAGHRGAGPLHEHAARDAQFLGPCVCAGHLFRGVELQPEICSLRTTQTATAESSEWVMEM